MPIVRTFQCGECFHRLEITLTGDDWDAPPPDCPACAQRAQMNQEFKPVAIGGSNRARAVKLAETITEEDYGVADMTIKGRQGERNKVRYKDTPATMPSEWTAAGNILNKAIAYGRMTRQQGGDGLDILQGALKSGAQPDLIEVSKKRALRVY